LVHVVRLARASTSQQVIQMKIGSSFLLIKVESVLDAFV
jgi:hypothetical protein